MFVCLFLFFFVVYAFFCPPEKLYQLYYINIGYFYFFETSGRFIKKKHGYRIFKVNSWYKEWKNWTDKIGQLTMISVQRIGGSGVDTSFFHRSGVSIIYK